jgi:LPS-assembly protein
LFSSPPFTEHRLARSVLLALGLLAFGQAAAQTVVQKLVVTQSKEPTAPLEGPIKLDADQVDGEGSKSIEASGKVKLSSFQRIVLADWLRYEAAEERIQARGKVSYRTRYETITGPELDYRLGSALGFITQPKFEFKRYKAYGSADRLAFVGQNQYTLINGEYTTCKGDNPTWCLRMSQLDIDDNTEIGQAKDAKIYFFGVPVFYWPSMSFPLGKERKSGFLAPTYGQTGVRGLEMSLPWYWNIADNLDATITPRYMTKRGLQLNNQFRYLFEGIKGEANVELLPDDQVLNQFRYGLHIKHEQRLFSQLSLSVDAGRVSDDAYFRDLSDRISTTSISTIPRAVAFTSTWDDWLLQARLQRYQTLQDPNLPITPPYDRTPQLIAQKTWRNWGGFDVRLAADYSKFIHASQPEGERLLLNPSISYPWRTPGAFIIPKFTYHFTDYKIHSADLDYRDTRRALPIVSLDSGLIFERNTSVFDKDYLQTLEPRLYYTRTPYLNQTKIPNFDSAVADFNFAQLFEENRYVGNDRIGDTDQLTLAATTRFISSQTGREQLRFSVGNRFYFTDQKVSLGELVRDTRASDILLAANGKLGEQWAFDGNMQFNTRAGVTERLSTTVRYQLDNRRALSASYRFARDVGIGTGVPQRVKTVDVSGQWPLLGGWHVVGRVNYTIPEKRVVEGIAGIEYDGGCWVGRLVMQRTITAQQQVTNSIYWQLDLSGLSRVGTSPLEVLKRNIPGYSQVNDLKLKRRAVEDGSGTWMTDDE